MHNRQSGAAHVPMTFFLLLMAMFLGALGYAFVMQSDNGELIKQRDAAQLDAKTLKAKDLLIEHYVADIGAVIGKPGKYEGRQGAAASYGGAVLLYPGIMNPAEVKKAMDDSLSTAGLSAASSLENVLGSLATRVGQAGERVKAIEAERDKALEEKSEVDRKFQTAQAEASAKANEFKTNLDQTRVDYETAKAEKEGRINLVNESLRTKSDELTTEKERAALKEKDLAKEIVNHQNHNSALIAKNALTKPPNVADGKILVAKNGIPTAFINLGRKDMLQPGTVFQVKNPSNSSVKGYATVTRVEEERAEVSLRDFVDPVGDFARAGDLLFNELYTPRVSRTIFLMGRFTAPHNKPELKNLLVRLGNKVVDKMAPGVDTVILGNDPVNEAGDGFASVQESDEFKRASDLRVEFIYLATISDLIKL